MEYINTCPVCEGTTPQPFLDVPDHFLSREVFSIVQCPSCQFLLTSPRPDPKDLPSYYHSAEYHSHTLQKKGLVPFLYSMVRNITLKKKVKTIEAYYPTGTLLDIGCGTGEFLNAAKQRGWQTHGIEPEPSPRHYAIQQYQLNVTDEASLETLPDHAFDVITLWHVLEHVPHLNERIQQLNRLLTNKGILVIAVPNAASWDARKYGPFWAAYDVPRHLYHFSPASLETLLAKHGFSVARKKGMIFDAFYISMLSEKYKHGKNRYPAALCNGFLSNLWALTHPPHYSSFYFVCKKQKTN